ncbi:glycoside hydrolase family 15 protein [soil metagenome]
MHKHSYDIGVIGNCAFLAHISKDTNVCWMCWPKFDTSFVFGSLLDKEKGGEFSIKPRNENFISHQFYIKNTNILCTEVECAEGKYRVTDFAPRFYQYDRYLRPLMLVRKIEPLNGVPRLKVVCNPVGNYGDFKPTTHSGSNHIQYRGFEKEIRLTTNISLSYIDEGKYFVLDEVKYLVLTYGAPLEAPLEGTAEEFLRQTTRYWRRWVKSTSIGNFFQEHVIRSALVLKIHQYEDTGAIIASATTSLPEFPNSGRNWDYRYCWLRDTYYTLTAFNNIGHFEEMEGYFNYIANISAQNQTRFQPLYTLSGGRNVEEIILDLDGYLGNKPVRVGNQAYEHIQNDVYGQVLVSLLPLYIDERFIDNQRHGSELIIYKTLKKLQEFIDEPDASLWEFRNFSQHHCYTYLFHWAGSNAALRIARILKDKNIEKIAYELRAKAASKIEACFDQKKGVYTQAVGTKNLDASTLQLIMMNYLSYDDPRAKSHLKQLENELKTPDGLFFRYVHKDDFGKPESTFMICSFWYAEALACVGRLEEATEAFESLLKFTNSLGLLSEDVDARTGSQWGNFPQAYSHVGLVNAAYRIANRLNRPNYL